MTPPPPAPTEPPAQGGRKKMWVLVLVAVLIVAALATVAILIISSAPPPAGVSLDHVTVTSTASTLYVTQFVTLTAVAVDTNSVAQTANASFAWSVSPTGAGTITNGSTQNVVRVTAKQAGSITVTATATLKGGSSKSGQMILTATGLAFVLTSSNSHPLVPYDPNQSPFVLTVAAVTSANVTFANYQGTVHFTSTDPTAALPADATFSVANAGVATFTNVSITLPGAVTITTTDTAFPSVTGSVTVYGNRAPVASFTITANPTDPRSISVDGSASTDPDTGQTATLTFSWAFGDGGSASGAMANHAYAAAGTYSIALTVSDIYAASNTAIKTYAAHSPPVAVVSVKSQTPNGVNTLVWANGSKSTGGDGTIVYYNWTWGDGNQTQTAIALAAHNYTSFWYGKTLTLTLRVANNYSLTNTSSATFLVTTAKLPPVATYTTSFTIGPVINGHTYRTLSADASGSSSPTLTALLYYVWSWGDGSAISNLTTPKTTHLYSADGAYLVNLTVIDANMLKGYYESTVIINVPAAAPVASFAISHVKLAVSVDASATTDVNNNIAFYIWGWGDGTADSNTTGPTSSHTYLNAGRYLITLTVWDTTNLKGTATGYASVATTTLDYSFSDFFNVPYGEWWDMRNFKYGDLPVNANCFNQTGYADGTCKTIVNSALSPYETAPYTNWYPAPFGSLSYFQHNNDPFIYGPYRMGVLGSNVPGYNLTEPVFLPVLDYNQKAGKSLSFRWDMQYLDVATASALTSAGCSGVKPSSDDGFMIRSQVYLTMDSQEAHRMFAIPVSDNTPALVQQWFNGVINPSCGVTSSLESTLANWLTNEANGKYDIFNEYQAAYFPLYTNMSRAVVDTDGTVHLAIDLAAWGTEVLLARWFYWGNASYVANYLDSTKAKGWYGMEVPWFEDFHFAGDLDTVAMNFNLQTVMEYHFQMGAAPGPDGCLRTQTGCTTPEVSPSDDVPYWTWGPWLADYAAPTPSHPYDELNRWGTQTYLHSTPGAYTYGQQGPYDYAPLAWPAKYGETWHFVFPANMPFYDPATSPIPSNPQGQLAKWKGQALSPYYMWKTNPSGYGTYTNSTWVWDVAGNVPQTGWPSGWPTNSPSPGIYPLVPWGSIYFAPWATTPTVVVPAAVVVSSASGQVVGLTTPSFGAMDLGSPLLSLNTAFVAAPALWRPAYVRIRV